MTNVVETKKVVGNFVDEEIRELIKLERSKRGWSYEELGRRIGVSASYIFRLEKGQRQNPSTKVLKALCELFDIDPGRVLLMEPHVLTVEGKTVNMDVVHEMFDMIMKMNVDKTSEVIVLLDRISTIQNLSKKEKA